VVIAVHFSAGNARSNPSVLQYRSAVEPRAPDKRDAAHIVLRDNSALC